MKHTIRSPNNGDILNTHFIFMLVGEHLFKKLNQDTQGPNARSRKGLEKWRYLG